MDRPTGVQVQMSRHTHHKAVGRDRRQPPMRIGIRAQRLDRVNHNRETARHAVTAEREMLRPDAQQHRLARPD